MTPSALLHRPTSPREIVQARWWFALLAVQFIVPAVSYLLTPEVAIGTLDQLNRLLGEAPTSSPSRAAMCGTCSRSAT